MKKKMSSWELFQYLLDHNNPITEKNKILQEYECKKEENKKNLIDKILEGASEQFKERFVPMLVEKLPCPVRMPYWLFRKYPDNPDFELNDLEKVVMAHVIHFTRPSIPTGYMECSGAIEQVTGYSPEEVHEALMSLVHKNMIICRDLSTDTKIDFLGHKRNLGYIINADYLHTILKLYGMDIWL